MFSRLLAPRRTMMLRPPSTDFALRERLFPSLLRFDPFFDSFSPFANYKDTYDVRLSVPGYKPADIKVKVLDNRLHVSGATKLEGMGGYERHEFSREFELPADVNKSSVRHQIEPDGVLVVQFDRGDAMERPPISNESTNEEFLIKFDVEGYPQNSLEVRLEDDCLIVEGKFHDEKDQNEKCFRRVVSLQSNLDRSTLKPVWKDDGYLTITGKYLPDSEGRQYKKLEISSE